MTFPASLRFRELPVLRSFGTRFGLSSGSGFFAVLPKNSRTSRDSDELFPSLWCFIMSTSHARSLRRVLLRRFSALAALLHLLGRGFLAGGRINPVHPAFLAFHLQPLAAHHFAHRAAGQLLADTRRRALRAALLLAFVEVNRVLAGSFRNNRTGNCHVYLLGREVKYWAPWGFLAECNSSGSELPACDVIT